MNKWVNSLEPVIYSADAIDRDLKRIVNVSYFNAAWAYPYFEVMYDLGVRAGEALNLNLWEVLHNGAVVLQPQKNNEKRIFSEADIPSDFLKLLTSGKPSPPLYNYSRLNRAFREFSMYHKIFVGEKHSTLHLFRHNFVKKLMLLDHEEEEIKQILGERKVESARAYIQSIFTNKPLTTYTNI